MNNDQENKEKQGNKNLTMKVLPILIVYIVGTAIAFFIAICFGSKPEETPIRYGYNYTKVDSWDREAKKEEMRKKQPTDYSSYTNPVVGMSEQYINTTKLGPAWSVKKCTSYDALDIDHKSKTYTWGAGKNWYFQAKVYYRKHYSNTVDEYVDLDEENGYVFYIAYYGPDGYMKTETYDIDDFYN